MRKIEQGFGPAHFFVADRYRRPQRLAKSSSVTRRVRNNQKQIPHTAAVMTVVHITLRMSRGTTGAPGSVPGVTVPSSACERTPKGSTANSTIHHATK